MATQTAAQPPGESKQELPYPVVDEKRLAKAAREYEHLVIDTQARPSSDELEDLAGGCDLLVIPSTPDALALDALMQTVEALDSVGGSYRVLLTIIPPAPSRDGDEAREMLTAAKLPHFRTGIRRFAAFSKAALSGRLVHQTRDVRGGFGWEDSHVAVGKEFHNSEQIQRNSRTAG